MTRFLTLAAVSSLALAACGDTASTDDMADGVTVTVEGIDEAGTVYVALQNEGMFGQADAAYGATMNATATTGSADVTITGVAPGDYAVAVFQDTNGNGQLDVGGNGVPTEPWALSNGAGTRGAPSFADAAMSFNGMDDRTTITLN